MKIAIAGVGAVGGLVAWHLARAGAAPILVVRPATAEALTAEGLMIVGPDGAETVRVHATSEPAHVGVCDLVLTGFKAHDMASALPLVAPLIGHRTTVAPMLNGIPWWYFQRHGGPHDGRRISAVDADGALATAIAPASIIGSVVYTGVTRETPTRLAWNGRFRLVAGELDGAESARLRELTDVLRGARLDAAACPDIRYEMWQKLLGNVTFNPMSVITSATIGRLATEPPLRRINKLIMEEAIAVARALGVTGPFDVDARLQVNPQMATFRTSMLQDFDAGRPLELGAIVAAVVELGQLTGVATPITETIGALAAERARAF